MQSRQHQKAFYSGLQVCGSVWTCPVCAAKISERRRLELLQAIERHQAGGGAVLLLTLTVPHTRFDKLSDVLEAQARALKSFWCARVMTGYQADMGMVGQVRAAEVTHGRKRAVNNGWHPHYHLLLFVRSGLDLEAWRERLYLRWAAACERAGLGRPSFEHGLRLDDGSKAAAYASKWGLESEMTKGHIKTAKDGETPFDLLRAYLANEEDSQAAALFREFAEAFKGKRQLFWSHGLKARFGVGEVSDEELAVRDDDEARELGQVGLDDWRRVLRVEGRATLLHVAQHAGWEGVQHYLAFLRDGGSQREVVALLQEQLSTEKGGSHG